MVVDNSCVFCTQVMVYAFVGTLWNPRVFGIDIKMLFYNVGAVGLLINIMSCSAANYYWRYSGDESLKAQPAGLSLAMLLYSVMFFWFLVDYVMFEKIHLYTYGTYKCLILF